MPGEDETEGQSVVPQPPEGGGRPVERTEQLVMLLKKVMGDDGYSPTQEQVDELLAQRKLTSGYIHEERMQEHARFKISSKDRKHYFYGALIFIAVLSGGVLVFQPQHFEQLLVAIVIFSGGFGFGRSTTSHKSSD